MKNDHMQNYSLSVKISADFSLVTKYQIPFLNMPDTV